MSVLWFVLCFAGPAQDSAEVTAIKTAALGYLDGWFKSDSQKMADALHPFLHKFRVKKVGDSEHEFIDVMTAEELIGISKINQEWVKNKGHQGPEILFHNADIAVVFAQSDGFYDLINLAKFNGEWKVVQVLWQTGEGKPKQ